MDFFFIKWFVAYTRTSRPLKMIEHLDPPWSWGTLATFSSEGSWPMLYLLFWELPVLCHGWVAGRNHGRVLAPGHQEPSWVLLALLLEKNIVDCCSRNLSSLAAFIWQFSVAGKLTNLVNPSTHHVGNHGNVKSDRQSARQNRELAARTVETF